MSLAVKENAKGISFSVRVTPRASANRAEGLAGEALKLKLTAPPVENAANRAVVEFFSKALGVAKSRVEIAAGGKSRNKTVAVAAEGKDREEVRRRLSALAGE